MDIAGITSLTDLYTSSAGPLHDPQAKAENFEALIQKAAEEGSDQELMTACKEFESYFLKLMLSEMRKTVNASSTSNAMNIFQDMLDDEYAKSSTSTGGVGLATFMYKQMKRQKAPNLPA